MFFSIGKPTETVHPRRVVSLAELGPAGRPRFNQRIFVKRAGRNRLALPGTFDEVIGVDFWHAVEFSRFGRTPSPAWLFRANRRRGNPLTIPSGLLTVKLVAAREGGQRMGSKARTIPRLDAPTRRSHLVVDWGLPRGPATVGGLKSPASCPFLPRGLTGETVCQGGPSDQIGWSGACESGRGRRRASRPRSRTRTGPGASLARPEPTREGRANVGVDSPRRH